VTAVSVKVEGIDKVRRALAAYGDRAEEVLDTELRKTAQDTRNKAVRSIQRGPKTGRIYPPVEGVRGMPHQASAPGQPPATDSGNLANSITFEKEPGSRPIYSVGTDEAYGAYLEFGTMRIAERPWLRPAVRAAVKGLARRVADGLRSIR
jgi:phage gpG-like protein